MKKILLVLLLTLFLPSTGFAIDYWVSYNGTAADDECVGAAKNGASACNLSVVNDVVAAGDTVYLRGNDRTTVGTYQVYEVSESSGTGEGIRVDVSGTVDNPITYTTYQDEMVHLQGNQDTDASARYRGIYLRNGVDYIRVIGGSETEFNLKVSKCAMLLAIGEIAITGEAGNEDQIGNEIAYIHFTDSYRFRDEPNYFQCSVMYNDSSYNHIHHNKFDYCGCMGSRSSSSGGDNYSADCDDDGDIFQVGHDPSTDEHRTDHFNIIEDNEFAYAGHGTLMVYDTAYTVIRNNNIHNDAWYDYTNHSDSENNSIYTNPNTGDNGQGRDYSDGLWSYRVMAFQASTGVSKGQLLEGNRIGGGDYDPEMSWSGAGIGFTSDEWIVRYNEFVDSIGGAFTFRGIDYYDQPTYENNTSANDNIFYNNTMYGHGYWSPSPNEGSPVTFWQLESNGGGIYDRNMDNVLKNNLYYNNEGNTVTGTELHRWTGGGSDSGDYALWQTFGNEWGQEFNVYDPPWQESPVLNINPYFIDNIIDLSLDNKPNLALQSNSPARDDAIHLTETNGTGSTSTALIVDDARYFQDGKFGSPVGYDVDKFPDSVGTVTPFQADFIAIGSTTNKSKIASISGNNITLVTALSWANNDPVYLYSKSDGVQVLYGALPDFGANEYSGSCEPDTCITLGNKDCGTPDDGCGTPLYCGACSGTETCESYVCTACVPVSSCDGGEACGNIDDGCDGLFACTDLCTGNEICVDWTCEEPPTSSGSSQFTCYFSDSGVPEVSLSPTISIWKTDWEGTITNPVTVGAMTEYASGTGGGFYYYNFTTADNATYYSIGNGGAGLTGAERYPLCESNAREEKINQILTIDVWSIEQKVDLALIDTGELLSDTTAIEADTKEILEYSSDIYSDTNNTDLVVGMIKDDTENIIVYTSVINWADISFIKAISAGRWEITGTSGNYQMILYDDVSGLAIQTFNLSEGAAPSFNERTPQ